MRARRLRRNVWLFCLLQFLTAVSFTYPVVTLLLRERLATTFNVGLVLALEGLATAALEIPTGYAADRVGRKAMIILMLACDAAMLVLLAIAQTLPHFLLFALLVGLSAALSSGTLDALLFDTLQELGQTSRHKKILGRIELFQSAGLVMASLVGGILASVSLVVPVYATLVPVGMALLLSLFLIEPAYHRPAEQVTFIGHVRDSFDSIVQSRQLLLLTLILLVGVNVFGPILDVRALFYAAKGVHIGAFGAFAALGMGLYALGAAVSHAVSERMGNKNTMLAAMCCIVCLIIAATFASGLAAAGVLVLAFFALGIHNPVESHLIHLEIASHQRATVLSSINFGKSLLLAASMPLMGFLADRVGIAQAYRLFLLPCIALFLFLQLLRHRKHA
jgi:MFS family permease